MTRSLSFFRIFAVVSIMMILMISGISIHQELAENGYSFVITDVHIKQNITTDVVWDSVGSPYIINSTIWIEKGASLTILPGTEVRFEKNSSLIVNGSLIAGGEGSYVDLESKGNIVAGSWEGLVLGAGSLSRFERVNISGANISLKAIGATDSAVRNSTFRSDAVSFDLDLGSNLRVYNSSLNYSTINVNDNRSILRTFALFSGVIVNHLQNPKDQVRAEMRDHQDILRLSHIVNNTGEIPIFMLEGHPFVQDGRDLEVGTYSISLSDNPFTHFVNFTYSYNGTGRTIETFRFTWPPELSSPPERINLYEDALAYHYTDVLDRNNVGSVEVRASSPAVSYNWMNKRLEFLYTNESKANETVTILLDDGYDQRSYQVEVNITPTNDPVSVIYPQTFIYLREDTPYELLLTIWDEDTPIEEINVTTDDPSNITYDPVETKLIFLYGDNTTSEFTVNVTVTDGISVNEKELIVFFQPVYYPPMFTGVVPNVTLYEDNSYVLDVGPYIYDPDQGEKIILTANVDDYDVFSARVDGFKVIIDPLQDAYGSGYILLKLTDEKDLVAGTSFNVTVLPVNDEPILTNGRIEEMGEGKYFFGLTYNDIDGDMPDSVTLVLGDDQYPMDLVPGEDLDPITGLSYSLSFNVDPGTYNVSFSCVQGEFMVDLFLDDLLIVPSRELVFQLSAYGGSLNLTIWGTGKGRSPTLVFPEKNWTPPQEMEYLGCAFRIVPNNISITNVEIKIWLFEFRPDILPISARLMYDQMGNWTQAGVGVYESSVGVYSLTLEGSILNSTLVMFVELDNEYDSDGDGVKNLLDAFPADPLEWDDTDRDGIGDNSDPDDDGDGFDDDIEDLAGTDPKTATSYPVDTDGDGILDYLDDDDDGDGMPDLWELKYPLDPLDPTDAGEDPDDDGLTNLEEYLEGTDPFTSDKKGDDGIGDELPIWVVILIASVLLILVIGVTGLLIFTRKHEDWEEEEVEEEWEIAGELDPEEAVDCMSCGAVFPIWMENCPKCGEKSIFSEE
jgi:hypothetical protein